MTMSRVRLFFFVAVMAAFCRAVCAQSPQIEHFERRIRPVLMEHCFECHSAESETTEGGLRLDSRDALRRGGDSGPALVAGKAPESLMLRAIEYKDSALQMPPDGKLPDRIIADFRAWIDAGAHDPRKDASPSPLDNEASGPGMSIEEGLQWWAFQPLAKHDVPVNHDEQGNTEIDWPQSKIDSFVLDKLHKNGLSPSPEADRRTLIRRAYLDLHGLPPTYEQIEAFVADESPTALEDLIEQLLRSPHYGERWGRHWLDVARWAEDHPTSEATNKPFPFAWKYRDWVIEAFNNDLAYNDFVRMQFAADLLPGFRPDDMRALGYLGNSPVTHKDARLSRDVTETLACDDWDERVDAVSRGLLGLTVACARCHDHKFDPITTEDYYGLAGVFASMWPAKRPIIEMPPDEAEQVVRDHERLYYMKGKLGNLSNQLSTISPDVHPLIRKLDKEMDELAAKLEKDDTPLTHAVVDWGVWIDGDTPTVTWIDLRPGQARDLPVFVRGNVTTPGKTVRRRFPTVLTRGTPRPFQSGSGRKELADAIVDDAGALAARVWVNRVWGWHFGQHLVPTPSDFGAQGKAPTHPRLLDDVAARFVENGWSTKWLHREILLSSTWRQSSRANVESESKDPTNRWLWRVTPQRVDFETWRDSILQAAGQLDLTMGGPSGKVDELGVARRTVYTRVSRGRLEYVFRLFDFPDANQHSPQRAITTTPLQQLFVLNSEWMRHQSEQLADRVVVDEDSPTERIENLFRHAFGRSPTPDETNTCSDYLEQRAADLGHRPWEELAQVLLGSNECIFRN